MKLKKLNKKFGWSVIILIVLTVGANAQYVATPVNYHPIATDLYGLNGANTIQPGQSWGELNSLASAQNPFCDMSVGHLRYPGGETTNFWDWKKGWFYSQYEMPVGITKPSKYTDNIGSGMDDGLAAFKQALDLSNSKPLFVLNPMTSTLADQIAMLQRKHPTNPLLNKQNRD